MYRVADSAPCVHNNKMTTHAAMITENGGVRNDIDSADGLLSLFFQRDDDDDDDRFFRCCCLCIILITDFSFARSFAN